MLTQIDKSIQEVFERLQQNIRKKRVLEKRRKPAKITLIRPCVDKNRQTDCVEARDYEGKRMNSPNRPYTQGNPS